MYNTLKGLDYILKAGIKTRKDILQKVEPVST